MTDFFQVWIAVLPVLVMMGAGFGLRRIGLFPEGMDRPVMRLVLNLLVPCLVLDRILGQPMLRDPRMLLWAVGLGFAFVVAGALISYFAAPVFGLSRGAGRRTFGLCCGIQNYGYIAIPVLEAVFGAGANLGVLFVHSVGVELAMWTLGVMMLSGSSRPQWRLMLNGPLIAVVAALILNFAGVDRWIPGFLGESISRLGNCSIPVSLVLVGVTFAELMRQWRPRLGVGVGACVLRLLAIPSLMLGTVYLLPVPSDLSRVIVVQAAMPAAVFPILLARIYGGHGKTAIDVVSVSSLVSVATIPLVVGLGQWLLEGRF